MANRRVNQRSFAGGEVTPEFWGRFDDATYQSGLATCRNCIVRPHGPVENRPGFAFVRAVKDSTKRTRLVPFTYNSTQTMVVEMGAGYFRFHTQGATLTTGSVTAWSNATAYTLGSLASRLGVNYYCILAHTNHQPPNATYWYPLTGSIYEIPSPYAEADLFEINHVQSGDVMTLVHQGHPVGELRRYGATDWRYTVVGFASTLEPPDNVVATEDPDGASDPEDQVYVVTAVGSDGLDESLASSTATCSNNIFEDGAYNTITWDAAAGAARYNVYRQENGLFGYIGQTDALTFKDNNIDADVSKTPPIDNDPFSGSGNYPGAVSYFEQRRWFAGTTNAPQTVWGTRSGTEANMNYSLPTRDDDSIQFRVAAREAARIRHIVPLQSMVLLTTSAEWRVTSVNNDAITPSSISVVPQSFIGAGPAQPVIVNSNIIFAAQRGGHIRELAFNNDAGGYITGDLSLRAIHLFDTYDVVDMAYSKAPTPIVWMVSTSGRLLGITYVPEQSIGGWHWHETDGVFESCAAVAEGAEDHLYVVVRRTIDGNTVRYIERMASRRFDEQADAFFVDSGVTYDGADTDTITGLDHLEGATVAILADGAVCPPQVVSGGEITLPAEAGKVHVGLPYVSDIKPLPLAFEVEGYGQGLRKNPNSVNLRVYRSSGVFAGPDADRLVQFKQRTTEPWGSPPALVTDEIEIVLQPEWGDDGIVMLRQTDPLPLTLLSMTVEFALGG